MKKLSVQIVAAFLFLFIFQITEAHSQVYSGRFTTSFYSWERQDSPTTTSGHLRVYQLASIKASDIGVNNLSFVSKFGYSTDFNNEAVNDPRIRIVNLYLKYKLSERKRLYLGRQRIYSGAVTVAYDGFKFTW